MQFSNWCWRLSLQTIHINNSLNVCFCCCGFCCSVDANISNEIFFVISFLFCFETEFLKIFVAVVVVFLLLLKKIVCVLRIIKTVGCLAKWFTFYLELVKIYFEHNSEKKKRYNFRFNWWETSNNSFASICFVLNDMVHHFLLSYNNHSITIHIFHHSQQPPNSFVHHRNKLMFILLSCSYLL